jgi:glycosyltransferase involved in cell wall biosynthesis
VRVAYLTGRYPGISHTFIMREVRALRALGVTVDTFSVWPTDSSLLLARADREEHQATVTLLPLRPWPTARAHLGALVGHPRRYLSTARQALALRRPGLRGWVLSVTWMLESIALWAHCRGRDIRHLHVHLNGTAPAVALLLVHFANGDRADEPDRWTWSMTVHGPSEFYDTLGERLAEKVRASSFVVCISDFCRSQLMGLVEERYWSKLHVVHCGVDHSVFAPPAPTASKQADSGERSAPGPLRVLNVGRLVPVKGHALLIRSIAELRALGVDATLTVIGDGPVRAELECLIGELELEAQVNLLGAIGQDEIVAHYQQADVFCMASFAEGVPVVLMEAMAQEMPVVAPAIMGIPELVEDRVSGMLVRPARADELTRALRELAQTPSLAGELGRRGREKVVEEFAIERCARQLLDIFGEYLTSGRSASSTRVGLHSVDGALVECRAQGGPSHNETTLRRVHERSE